MADFYKLNNDSWNTPNAWSDSAGGDPVVGAPTTSDDTAYLEGYTTLVDTDISGVHVNFGIGGVLTIPSDAGNYSLGNVIIDNGGTLNLQKDTALVSLTMNSGEVVANNNFSVSGTTNLSGNAAITALQMQCAILLISGDSVDISADLDVVYIEADGNGYSITGTITVEESCGFSGSFAGMGAHLVIESTVFLFNLGEDVKFATITLESSTTMSMRVYESVTVGDGVELKSALVKIDGTGGSDLITLGTGASIVDNEGGNVTIEVDTVNWSAGNKTLIAGDTSNVHSVILHYITHAAVTDDLIIPEGIELAGFNIEGDGETELIINGASYKDDSEIIQNSSVGLTIAGTMTEAKRINVQVMSGDLTFGEDCVFKTANNGSDVFSVSGGRVFIQTGADVSADGNVYFGVDGEINLNGTLRLKGNITFPFGLPFNVSSNPEDERLLAVEAGQITCDGTIFSHLSLGSEGDPVTFNGNATIKGKMLLTNGVWSTEGAVLTLTGGDISSGGDILDNAGAFIDGTDITIAPTGNKTLNIAGDWSNVESPIMQYILDTDNNIINHVPVVASHLVVSGSGSNNVLNFQDITLDEEAETSTIDSAGVSVNIADALTIVGDFTVTAGTFNMDPGSALVMGAGKTFSISHLSLSGSIGNLITLRSSVDDSSWFLVASTSSLSYVDAKDSDASGGVEIIAPSSTNVDSGNNINWNFSAMVNFSLATGDWVRDVSKFSGSSSNYEEKTMLNSAAINSDSLDASGLSLIGESVAEQELAELVGDPGATPKLKDALMLLFMALRNKETASASTGRTIANDAGDTILTSTVTDNGSLMTKNKLS